MPWDFPDSPVAGDAVTLGGVDYVYDGMVWNLAGGGAMTDYVLKAGDTMFAPLWIEGSDPTMGQLRLSGGGGTQAGIVEWIAPRAAATDPIVRLGYLGWGSATDLTWRFENGCTGLTLGGDLRMGDGQGIHWASTSAVADKFDFSEGICLYGYGGTSQFGFTITSGTLNYVVQNAGNDHEFWCGPRLALRIQDDYVLTGHTTAGVGYYVGDPWHGYCFNGSNISEFVEFHAIWRWYKRTTGTSGGENCFEVDQDGYRAQRAYLTAPEIVTEAKADPLLRPFVKPRPKYEAFDKDEDEVNLGALLMHALGRIKALEAEVAALKGGPKPPTTPATTRPTAPQRRR
jgi:hypothetical protein